MDVLAGVRRGHDRQLSRRQVEGLDPARFDEGQQAERLDARAQGDQPIRIADRADQATTDVDFDDISAMDGFDDPVPDLADEDRRRAVPDRRATGCPVARAWAHRGGGIGGADTAAGHSPRIPRGDARMPSVSNPEAPATAWPSLHVSSHPAVLHKLAILRSTTTEPKKFREVVRELSWLLGYEALADIAVRSIEIETPLEPMAASELADRIGLVPILRAGLGMVDAMLELMPTAQVWHLGLFRDERTLRPVEYYNKLPDSATVDLCLILDPMLATGGSATAAIEVLKRWGAVRIKLVNLIAAPEGVAAVTAAHPDVEIYCAALDRQLNEKGYIMPGLGDAGDRQFGTGRWLPSAAWATFARAAVRPGSTLSDAIRWKTTPARSACSRAPTSTSYRISRWSARNWTGTTITEVPAGRGDRRHQVGEVGLHPFARLVAGALPAELPAIRGEAGGRRHCLGRGA